MALIPEALTTLNTAKEHLGIDVSDTEYNTVLEIYINAFSQYVAKYLGRQLRKSESAQTLTIDGNDGERLYLPVAPIVTFTSIAQDGVAVASGDYVRDDEKGILRRKNGDTWPAGVGNFTIVGIFGWVMPNDEGTRTLPYDLELACLKAVGAVFNKRTAEGTSSTGSGGMNANWSKIIKDEDIASLLAPYRSYSIIGG